MKRSFISLLLCTALVCCAAFTPAEARGSGSGDLQWVDELLKAPAAEQPKEGPSETDAGRAPDEGDKPAGMTLTDQTAPPTDTPSPTDTPAPTETPRPAETPEPAETAAITGISFNTAKGLTLSVNEKADLSAMLVLKPANASARGLKWTVSDAAAASVSEDGMLSPRMAGTVTVTVTDPASKKSAKLRVTVTQPVESIELSESYLTVFKGKTARITARVLPESASNKKLKWESEDSNVARVSANGTVTGTGAGTTWIHCRATDGTGKEKLIRVTVNVAVKRIPAQPARHRLRQFGRNGDREESRLVRHHRGREGRKRRDGKVYGLCGAEETGICGSSLVAAEILREDGAFRRGHNQQLREPENQRLYLRDQVLCERAQHPPDQLALFLEKNGQPGQESHVGMVLFHRAGPDDRLPCRTEGHGRLFRGRDLLRDTGFASGNRPV